MIFYQKSYFIIGLFEISLSVSKLLLFAGNFLVARRHITGEGGVGWGPAGRLGVSPAFLKAVTSDPAC